MGLLSYSHTLVAGATENINDVQDMFNDAKTLVNGNLDATNLATSAKPVTLLGQYRTVADLVIAFAGGDTAGAYYATAGGGHVASGAGSSSAPAFFRLAPADYAVSGLTTQFRVAGALATNSNAPAANFTAGLNAVTFSGSLSNIIMTTAASVASSTFTRSTPSASTGYTDASSDFSLSTAGVYTLGVTTSATLAASSLVVLALRLEVRHI